MKSVDRPLRVFLCHSSNDKPAVRELYQKLRAEAWIQPWLDEEELYPGQDWNLEIEKAVEASDAILVFLTKGSINKEGYIQRELRIVLDLADYKPEGTLFIIPVRLEECDPPRRLRPWQYADYFAGSRDRAFQRLLVSLKRRAEGLDIQIDIPSPTSAQQQTASVPSMEKHLPTQQKPTIEAPKPSPMTIPSSKITLSNGMEMLCVPAGKFLMGSKTDDKLADADEKPQHTVEIPYDYWMARFPVTNELYNAYVKSIGVKHPVAGWEEKNDHPVAYVKWTDAMAYCQWLNSLLKTELPSGLLLRLPTEAEWEKVARWKSSSLWRAQGAVLTGEVVSKDEGEALEYPWGNTFDKNKCNTSEGGKRGTTSVGLYSPQGDSPYGCADMGGNVWEWTHSLFEPYPYRANDGSNDEKAPTVRVLRGGSFDNNGRFTRCACRQYFGYLGFPSGFRVVVAPELP